ncbi:hypothetical protein HELRODRAFT_180503 [Helobdella robusta]|uniref:Spermatogenesis-associated protein 17 n=1 Tax=Helobdella robusta TaxID=6412 RepID=T1FFZ9_HELRO|nr:hypothetical protein HELRODRAFT_180503 [Helobdella robusta]ESN93852.1 hypothetical protein HELRODRAFT_180503 [Helobdella robusta]
MKDWIDLKLSQDLFIDEIYERVQIAEYYRKNEYDKCVKIQAWFRGIKVRAYLKYLNRCALKIQKVWKGSRDRERVTEMRVIQKIWRGYYSRRCRFNVAERKKYLNEIQRKNSLIRQEQFEKAQELEEKMRMKIARDDVILLQNYVEKNHYLLSTQSIPGVYNNPYKLAPDCLEFKLREVRVSPKFRRYKERAVSNFAISSTMPYQQKSQHLPPKLQGPFKLPHLVHQQKTKPLSLSLIAESEYDSVEKCRERMKIDDMVKRICDRDFITYAKPEPACNIPSIFLPHVSATDRIVRNCLTKNFKPTFPPIK